MKMRRGGGQQAAAPVPDNGASPEQVPPGQAPQSVSPTQAQPAPGQPGKPAPPHKVRRTRVGGVWVALALFALVLLLLLIFILENSQTVAISFFGAKGHLPLGVALLLTAVLGVLLVVIPGTARIMQLRRTARRHRKQDIQPAEPPAAQPAAAQLPAGQAPDAQPPADPPQAPGPPA
jgi:uncharacterized integral membrane protein